MTIEVGIAAIITATGAAVALVVKAITLSRCRLVRCCDCLECERDVIVSHGAPPRPMSAIPASDRQTKKPAPAPAPAAAAAAAIIRDFPRRPNWRQELAVAPAPFKGAAPFEPF